MGVFISVEMWQCRLYVYNYVFLYMYRYVCRYSKQSMLYNKVSAQLVIHSLSCLFATTCLYLCVCKIVHLSLYSHPILFVTQMRGSYVTAVCVN